MRAADDLRSALVECLPKLQALSEGAASAKRSEGKWARKEVLGHLIDSAVNNHQRFVRAQLQARLVWPGYEQEAWVRVQRYAERSWRELLFLWEALNLHLAHVMEAVPAERLETPCVIDDKPVTLGWLMTDYVRHLRHHVAQILAG